MSPPPRPRLSHVSLLDRGTVAFVRWTDGKVARFHAVWLRDNAQDPQTRDQGNGQRLITIHDIAPDIRVIGAQVTTDSLSIRFAPDGYETTFQGDWLLANRYDVARQIDRGSPPRWVETWDARFSAVLPVTEYEAARADLAALAQWLAAVRRYGFAVMRGVPTVAGAVTEVVSLFGFVRETNYGRLFDVRTRADPVNLAYTGRALQVHTDNPYRDPVPTLQLLHCLASESAGGESVLVDGFQAVAVLRAQALDDFELLAGYRVPFEYRGQGSVHLCARAPVIRLSPEGELLGVRFNNRSAAPFDLPFDFVPQYYAAYRRFAVILERAELQISFRMGPGDLFIVDNERVLHGRKGYASAGSRHLQGCYADRDGLYSTLAVLEETPGTEAA